MTPVAGRGAIALLLALGVAGAGAQLAASRARDALLTGDVADLAAVADAKVAITETHLWMEELVSGEQLPDPTVMAGVERALADVDTIIERRHAEIAPPLEHEIEGRIAALSAAIESFRHETETRVQAYRAGALVGVGTEADEAYDARFFALAEQADEIRRGLEQRVSERTAHARWFSGAMLLGWMLAVALASGALLRHERNRAQQREALRQRDEQLAHSRKMEALARLSAGLVHDVNNYLTAISAQAELAQRKPPAPGDEAGALRLKRRLADIVTAANRAAAHIRRLLALGNNEPATPGALRVDDALREAEPLLRQIVGGGVQLAIALPPQATLAAHVDALELERVLVNLVVNACEAGAQLVRVDARHVQLPQSAPAGLRIPVAPGPYVLVGISDDGGGIPPDALRAIFEPNFTTRSGERNAGLGLATVYAILQRCGGSIAVESVPGQGTRFSVLLREAAPDTTRISDDDQADAA
ncbi:MAG TPA: ATP-binding protein [Xanthomonadales bacterium]|nr:ATP-binding protein [Xanthomonadales bacterium]